MINSNNHKILIFLLISITGGVAIFLSASPDEEIVLPEDKKNNEQKMAAEKCTIKSDTMYYATSPNFMAISFPEKYENIQIIFDEFSAAEGDSIFGEVMFHNREGCRTGRLRFYTNTNESKAYLTASTKDSKEQIEISIVITNQIDWSNISGVPQEILSLLTPYTNNWWRPAVLLKEDLNLDSYEDYVLALKDGYLTKRSNGKIHNEQSKKLVIITSQVDGSYDISGFSEHVLLCGTCGGINFVDPGQGATYDYKNNIIQVRHYGGTNWRWSTVTDVKDIHNEWYITRQYDFATNLNDYSGDKSITEKTFMIPLSEWTPESKYISKKEFISPDEFDTNLAKSAREIALDNYKYFPEEFSTTTYDGFVYALVPYHESSSKQKFSNFTIESGVNSKQKDFIHTGGTFLMRGLEVVWESDVKILATDFESTYFWDLTGDEVEEIILSDKRDSSLPSGCDFYIYQWKSGRLENISPKLSDETKNWCSWQEGNFTDLDKDGVLEIITFDENGNQKVYKFNGEEYYLWKEERVTVPEE